MKWKPSYFTREQMEERRREGGRLLREGKLSKVEIARQLGVSRASVTLGEVIGSKRPKRFDRYKSVWANLKVECRTEEKAETTVETRSQASQDS